MVPVIPWYITLAVIVAQPVIALAVWRILAARAPTNVRIGLAVFLFGWLGLAFAFAPSAASLAGGDPYTVATPIPLFAIGSLSIALLAVLVTPGLRRAIGEASLPALVGVQIYRTLGLLFVILLALGQLPGYFAQPAGWGDIFVGLTAPLVALALVRRAAGARALAVAWNVFGLLDLVVAIGMGTGKLAPYLVPALGSRVPTATAMGAFPLILVPTFLVPLSIMLHGLALARLRNEGREGSRLVARTVG